MKRPFTSSCDDGGVTILSGQMELDYYPPPPFTCITNTPFASSPRVSPSKRRCGGHGRSVGAMGHAEVAAWLNGLAASLGISNIVAPLGVDDRLWTAFAELNSRQAEFVSLSHQENLLRIYSGLRTNRYQAWINYATRGGLSEATIIAMAQGEAPACSAAPWLQLLAFLLCYVLQPYPDICIDEIDINMPPALLAWAARWGVNEGRTTLKLLRIEAYHREVKLDAHRPPQAARSLYVPVWI